MAVLKKLLLTCGILLLATFSACNNKAQNEAKQVAEQIKATVKENRPGVVPTNPAGYRMKARIDGKEWEATSMMPLANIDRVIGYKDGSYIGFPMNTRYLKVGKKIEFSEDNAADLSLDGTEGGIWGGRKGEVEITKMDDQWLEGTFYFTGSSHSTNRIVAVTDGSFRIALPAKGAR